MSRLAVSARNLGFPELLERLQLHLRERGYRPSSVVACHRVGQQLLDWLASRHRGLGEADERLLGVFGRLQRQAGRSPLQRSVIDFWRAEGLLPRAPEKPLPAVLVDFRRFMSAHRGVMDSTLDGYCVVLKALLDSVGEDPRRYTPEALQHFVLTRAQVDHGGHVVTPVRMFLRYLACQGQVKAALKDAVPTVAHWRLAALPRGISPSEIRCLLRACDRKTPVGRRDRAVLLLGSQLALRPQDIAALRLTDIDWRQASLTVAGKGRRASRLPLPQQVGDAILDYLKDGRPKVADDHLLLRVLAPLGPLTRWAVSDIVDRALRRAGLNAPSRGGYLLRHSAATDLLRRGAPLHSIAALLRHRSIETTTIYAKVDFKNLLSIAQPWPQVQPC